MQIGARRWLLAAVCGLSCFLSVPTVSLAQRKSGGSRQQQKLPDLKTHEDKLKFLMMIRSTFPTLRSGRSANFHSGDLDNSLERYVTRGTDTPLAPIIDDETFIRRVSLDVTGKRPSPAQIEKFVADDDPRKRSRLIDELLESDDFARKWARYWQTVIFYDSNANRNTVNPEALEDWLFEQFKKNTPWDWIVAELVSATPERKRGVRSRDNGWNQDHGPNNFILACERNPEIIASQTARIFMGISIGCAECHDHPFDRWKREQFHELAAFFARGKYYMTDQDDPSERSEVQARFLLGEKPDPTLKPDQRRVAGAAYLIYNPDNYWFARAYVNRVWNELIGDGFYSVDSLGPDQDVVHQLVANRIGATFRHARFDTRWLFRLILNSRAYQREIRTLEEERDLFTAVRPARLRPYEVADNVEQVIGRDRNLWRQVASAFEADPSIPQRDLEGSIQQALVMMNNNTLNSRLANGELQKHLSGIKDDRNMIREAFLALLARSPTSEEFTRYEKFIQESDNRQEAVVDILWVLINSAEFVTKR